jgi:fatty acid amide hydrolase 2
MPGLEPRPPLAYIVATDIPLQKENPMDRLLTLSGSELARMIRDGEITSTHAVETHIKHIQRVNPELNAMVATRFDQARAEAAEADAALAKSGAKKALPPFHGVPCSIKECFAFVGMPNTSGIVSRQDIAPEADATAVSRLRAAGAIPMGVTNTSEGCMWMESSNYVYGRTNNPYNPTRIVGGSSGGEGAIIGAGGAPFGLGSDIGGSIRMPAFFNGVFGHKPSGGLVPGTGQFPLAAGPALRYLATGPLARRAEDLWPLLNILRGPDGVDGGCEDMTIGDPKKVNFDKLRVLVVRGNGVNAVSAEMAAAQTGAAQALAKRGARIQETSFDAFRHSRDIWMSMLAQAGSQPFAEVIGEQKLGAALGELGKSILRRSEHTFPAIVLAVIERFPALMPARTEKFAKLGQELRAEFDEALGEDGIMLFPSYPNTAPAHNKPLFPPFNWVYTAILNVMEAAVTQTPLGLDSQGLPLGVQVAAPRGGDHLTIAAAIALEADLGGWTPPPRLA